MVARQSNFDGTVILDLFSLLTHGVDSFTLREKVTSFNERSTVYFE